MAFKKSTRTVTSDEDNYYVIYEDADKLLIVNDDAAFAIEKDSKNATLNDSVLLMVAEIIIDKATRTVIKSRSF